MSYTIKSALVADIVALVAVDDDGTTIRDFVSGNSITLDSGVAASVATGAWKSMSSPKYFVTTDPGSFGMNGVRWATTRPTVDETDADGMSSGIVCHGASNCTAFSNSFIEFSNTEGNPAGLQRVSNSNAHGRIIGLGGTVANTATNLPTDGTTKFTFIGNYESGVDSEVFYGLESGSLASDGTAGNDGGWGSTMTLYAIGGDPGQGAQPFKPYCAFVMKRKLSLSECQSIHADFKAFFFNAAALGGAITTATETDSAQPITRLKAKAVGIASETDSAQPIAEVKQRTAGIATETDSALAIAHAKAKAVGIAAETDSAMAVTSGFAVAVGTASETDSALAVSRLKSDAITLAAETDEALPITRAAVATLPYLVVRTKPRPGRGPFSVGKFYVRSGSVAALPPDLGEFITVNTAIETDSALAMTHLKTKAIGIASESDAAQPIGVGGPIPVGMALETDLALTVTARKAKLVGIATETDTALAVLRAKSRQLGIALEFDSALAIGRTGGSTPASQSSYGVIGYRRSELR